MTARSRASERNGPGLLLAALAASTAWVAMLAWRGFAEEPSTYLAPLLAIALLISGTGAGCRALRVPTGLTALAQVAVAAVSTSVVLTGSPVPLGATWSQAVTDFAGAVDTANQYAAPVPSDAGFPIDPLMIVGGVASLLLIDFLACTLRRVPAAGLPLLAVYSVPVSMLDSQVSWWVFALTAAGFLGMLYVRESETLTGWGRPLGMALDDEHHVMDTRTGAMRGTAGRIGGVATVLAVAVPVIVPTLSLDVFDFGPGSGGDSDVEIENPIADLRRDLNREADVALLTVTTDDPSPAYLRISVLNWFTDNEWRSGDRDIPTENLPNGQMPPLQGVSPAIGQRAYSYAVDIEERFESTWLPTQSPIAEIEAPGNWRYDVSTMDFLAADDDLNTAGLSYSMTAVDLDLKARDLADAPPSSSAVDEQLLELPSDLPDIVSTLARSVTENAESPYEQAVALQDWFREDGGFEYSLERAEAGNGVDELEAFLREDGRVGYCEQFAASMAVMARELGIPARLGVGFLRPEQIAPSTWEYSSDDLHVWPELFFAGYGWVRFEPTPADRAETVPDYTQQRVPTGAPETPETPQQPADPEPSQRPDVPAPPMPEAGSEDQAGGGSGFPWLRVGGWVAGLLLLVAAAWAPRTLRLRRRQDRLLAGPEEAWAELRDTVLDLGLTWPTSRSPRETADHLDPMLGRPGGAPYEYHPERTDPIVEARAALDRIVGALEVERYARKGGDTSPGALGEDVTTCLTSLSAGVKPLARRRAEWLPTSLLTGWRTTRRTEEEPTDSPEAAGVMVERI